MMTELTFSIGNWLHAAGMHLGLVRDRVHVDHASLGPLCISHARLRHSKGRTGLTGIVTNCGTQLVTFELRSEFKTSAGEISPDGKCKFVPFTPGTEAVFSMGTDNQDVDTAKVWAVNVEETERIPTPNSSVHGIPRR